MMVHHFITEASLHPGWHGPRPYEADSRDHYRHAGKARVRHVGAVAAHFARDRVYLAQENVVLYRSFWGTIGQYRQLGCFPFLPPKSFRYAFWLAGEANLENVSAN